MKKEKIKEFSIYILIIVFVILIRTFVITPVKVNGTSMVDTLHNGDTMILNKIGVKVTDIKNAVAQAIKNGKTAVYSR